MGIWGWSGRLWVPLFLYSWWFVLHMAVLNWSDRWVHVQNPHLSVFLTSYYLRARRRRYHEDIILDRNHNDRLLQVTHMMAIIYCNYLNKGRSRPCFLLKPFNSFSRSFKGNDEAIGCPIVTIIIIVIIIIIIIIIICVNLIQEKEVLEFLGTHSGGSQGEKLRTNKSKSIAIWVMRPNILQRLAVVHWGWHPWPLLFKSTLECSNPYEVQCK